MNASPTPRVLGYIRVSTDEQAETGYSLPDQDRRIREHCAAAGWNLTAIISDDFTGKTLKRPGLKEVTARADAREFNLLLCVKLDRLARQNYLRRQYERQLEERGIEVLFTEQRFDASPAGRFQRGIMGEVAEFEAELIRERTMSGKRQMAVGQGRMPGCSDPFGYRQVRRAEAEAIEEFRGRSGELLIVEEQAEIVREMYQRVLAGGSMRAVASWLFEAGIRPPKAKPGEPLKRWQVSAVSNILRSSTYIGRRIWGQVQARQTEDVTSTGRIRIKHTPAPREQWVELPCPAILPEAIWHAVQQRLDENREQARRKPNEVHILQGSVYCSECVTKRLLPRMCSVVYVGAGDRRERRYRCSSCITDGVTPYCGVSFPAEPLEAMALDALERAAVPGFLAARERRRAAQSLSGFEDAQGALSRLQKERASLDAEEERIAGLMLKGISEHVTQKMLIPVQQRRIDVDRQIAAATASLGKAQDPEEAALVGEEFGTWIREQLAAVRSDPERLRQLFRLTTRIVLQPKKEGARPEPEIEIVLPEGAIVYYTER